MTRRSAPIRLLTYNILLGGAGREERIRGVLERSGADLIALQEVSDTAMVRRIAEALGMELIVGAASDGSGMNVAVLTRLPVVRHRNHRHRTMLRSNLEVIVDPGTGTPLRIHALHLPARFGERSKGEARRIRELDTVLADIRRAGAAPHVVLGDFNALAPGDHVEATRFFRKMNDLRRARVVVRQADGLMGPRRRDGMDRSIDEAWLAAGIDPHLDVGIPALPPVVGPLTTLVPVSRRIDRALGGIIERWTVERMLAAGYVDAYRRIHPRAYGYTCATWLPAARIDYIFLSPELAPALRHAEVIGSRAAPDAEAHTASDHFPLLADLVLTR
jgi:endonuclease/exonuclease/phosphatase family metal-dependent hydrolase